MEENPRFITDLSFAELAQSIADLGLPAYRARQIREWVYQKYASSFDDMTNLPQPARDRLAEKISLHALTILQEVKDRGDGTVKALFSLPDGRTIESALMPYPSVAGGRTRYTVCVSTQVGCPVGCAFCATGQQGFERNLRAGEIIDQVLYFARALKEKGDSITNIVFMGMGEPLANYDAVWQAIERLNSPEGFGLGARNMTVSTAGMVPGIQRFAKEKLQVGLAISLHAADDDLRNRLVPLNRKYPVPMLMAAVRDYFEKTGRRPSFEYILFAGINDSLEQARVLAHLLRGLNCHVNLITANRTNDPRFQPPPRNTVLAFEEELKRLHIVCTVRQRRGLEIDAGCGQLRSRFLKAQITTTKS